MFEASFFVNQLLSIVHLGGSTVLSDRDRDKNRSLYISTVCYWMYSEEENNNTAYVATSALGHDGFARCYTNSTDTDYVLV